MKICVAAICRNEEKNIQGWLEHVAGADAISIVDTGSTDGTTDIISNFSHPNLYHMHDVGEERNLGASRELAATPFHENDLVVWLDIDERFDDPDWVTKLRKMVNIHQVDAVWILMRNGESHYDQMKAYKRRAYTWRYRAHEVLIRKGEGKGRNIPRAPFATDHYPDAEKPRDYLMELARDVGDYPRDERCSFYYARELCYAVIYGDRADLLDDARREVERLRKLATWADYITLSHLELSKALYMQGFTQDAINACYVAIAHRPDRVECYGILCDIFYRRGDNMNAVGMAMQGISVTQHNPKSFLFDQTSINLDMCYDVAYWGCRNLGLFEPAINYLAQMTHHRGQDVNEAVMASGLLQYLKQPATQENDSNDESCETQDGAGAESGEQRRADDYQVRSVSDSGEQSKPD